jgi:uncharacterized protein
METMRPSIAFVAALCIAQAAASGADYPFQPVADRDVRFQDGFWAPRIETNRVVTLEHVWKQCEASGQLGNFAKAAGLMPGAFRTHPPRDSDIYKLVESASRILAAQPNRALERRLDSLIAQIAAAQEPDGYVYTARRLIPPEKMPAMAGPKRWLNEQHSHELYVAGHLYEAAAAHYQATGKRTLLDVAIKNADLVAEVFGPGKLQLPPGHEEIEIGLAKLYRVTGDKKYLDLDKFLIELRGRPETHRLFGPYCQDHQPVTEQSAAVGHAVRAAYLYCGMADVAALTADPAYIKALDRIWDDVVTRKLSITGGIGPRRAGESFGDAYELPNAEAYNETCAAVANALWNYRLFLLHGDAKYLDVFERVLYNGFLSGVSLSGDRFFYENPLASRGGYRRSPWFGTPCCPTNVVRFMPSIAGCVYATRESALFVNLFASGSATVKLKDNTVKITQLTRYPWDGRVRIAVEPEAESAVTLCLRIPGWVRNQPVPGDLYRFADANDALPSIRVQGEPVKFEVTQGFARLTRQWHKGETIDLDLPMPVRRIVAHPAVKADVGRVAIQRGPIVYCAEGADNNGRALNLVLPDEARLWAEDRRELLGGVTVIRGAARVSTGTTHDASASASVPFTAIPYYAWGNRGDGEMVVWFARAKP